MKIRSVTIDGFGIFSQASIDPAPGLTVISAPNGNGKTTFRDFLRACLFGFPAGNTGNRYERPNGDYGGAIQFEAGDGVTYNLQFDAARKKQRVTRADGQPATELGDILKGAPSREIYHDIFAVGLTEIQNTKTVKSAAIRDLIGGFGSGQSGKSFSNVRSTVSTRTEALFKPRGQSPLINAALANFEKLKDERRIIGRDNDEYSHLGTQLVNLRSEVQDTRRAESELMRRESHLKNLHRAWPHWVELQGLRSQLDAIQPVVDSFPPGAETQFEKLGADDVKCTDEHEKASRAKRAAEEELERLVVREELLKESAVLDELVENLQLQNNAVEQKARLSDELRRIESDYRDELTRLGPVLQDKLLDFDDTVRSLAQKDELATHLANAQNAVADVNRHLERHQRSESIVQQAVVQRAEQAAKWSPAPPHHEAIDGRLSKLDAVRKGFADLAVIDDKHRSIRNEVDEAERRLGTARSRLSDAAGATAARAGGAGRPPLWLAWAVLVGATLLAAALYRNLPEAILLFSLGLVLSLVIYFWWKSSGLQSTAEEPDYLRRDVADCQLRVDGLESQSTSLSEQLAAVTKAQEARCIECCGRLITAPEVDDFQKNLVNLRAKRRQFEEDERQVQELEQKSCEYVAELHQIELEQRNLEEPFNKAREKWECWLRERGLDADVTPAVADKICIQAKIVRDLHRKRSKCEDELKRTNVQVETGNLRALSFFEAIGVPLPVPEDMGMTLRTLRSHRDISRKHAERRDELKRSLPLLEAALKESAVQLQTLQAQKAELFTRAGAVDSSSFVERAAAWKERCRVVDAQSQCVRQFETLSAPGEPARQFEKELSQLELETLERETSQVESEIKSLRAVIDNKNQLCGSFEEKQRKLVDFDHMVELDQHIETAREQIREMANEWATYKIASWLLERARAKIEAERQPTVLRTASACLNTISSGRFTALGQSLDAKDSPDYYVVDSGGKRHANPEIWNTALRDKSYLSLRFGLIDAYSDSGEPLPIVLDDALVNLDPFFCLGGARCLAEVAKRHQVFYLTCHPHTLDYFRQLDPLPAHYEIKDGLFHAAPLTA